MNVLFRKTSILIFLIISSALFALTASFAEDAANSGISMVEGNKENGLSENSVAAKESSSALEKKSAGDFEDDAAVANDGSSSENDANGDNSKESDLTKKASKPSKKIETTETIISSVQLPEVLTIDDAIDYALNNNYDIQNQKASLLNASGMLKQAKASFDIKTGASTTYSRNNTPYDKNNLAVKSGDDILYTNIENQEFTTKAFVEKLFAFGINARLSYSITRTKSKYTGGEYAIDSYYASYGHPNYNNQGTIALELSVPIFKSFKSAIADRNLQSAEENYKAMEFNLDDMICKTVMKTSEVFWKYYVAVEKYKQQEKLKSRIEQRIKNTQRLVQAGVRSQNDLLRIQVNALENQRSLDSAKIEVMSAKLELAQQIGIPVEKVPDPQIDFPEINLEKDFPTEDVFTNEKIEQIASNRPDIKALIKSRDAALQKYNAAKIQARPDLNFNFSIGTTGALYGNGADKYLGAAFKNNKGINISGGLEFNMPVQNNEKKGAVEQAESQFNQADINFKKQKDSIVLQIRNAVSALNTYKESVKGAKNILNLQEKVYDNETKRYEAGLTTIDNLITQDNNWIDANINYYQIFITYLSYALQFKYSTGTLLNLNTEAAESASAKEYYDIK